MSIIKGRTSRALIVLFIIISASGTYLALQDTSVKVGVMLPLSGDLDMEFRQTLDWACETINSSGGIGGKQVELVYYDTNAIAAVDAAKDILAHDDIRVTIGPMTSDELYDVAPLFIENERLLISPLTTSSEAFRVYGKEWYFWRTCPGDVAQVQTIFSLLHQKGISSVALLYEDTSYGKTFFEWCGFFATETGIDLVSLTPFERGNVKEESVSEALALDPDYILVAGLPQDTAPIKTYVDASECDVGFFVSDASVMQSLIDTLGDAAEGIEGVSPSYDPHTGFHVAYGETFGTLPHYSSSQVYDALLLASYIYARNEYAGGKLQDCATDVIYGDGAIKGWDMQESYEAIEMLLEGELPNVSGTSGPLDYDCEYGVDPLTTYYAYWIVEAGSFRQQSVVCSTPFTSDDSSVSRSHASTRFATLQTSDDMASIELGPHEDSWAVLVSLSRDWENYRHQADALSMYHFLKDSGFDDDHIILLSYDDVAYVEENSLPGDIHHECDGKNLYEDVIIDYAGACVTPGLLENVLIGHETYATPTVLCSNESSNVFLYIVGHGAPGGVAFHNGEILQSGEFCSLLETMHDTGMYRQLFVMMDTCFGESMACGCDVEGMVLFTGASSTEPSFGAVYDPLISQWLTDEFSNTVLTILEQTPDVTIQELYLQTYRQVVGSHACLVDYENFGTLETSIMEFLS